MSRYHPLLITLHWLLAGLIIGMLIFGFAVLSVKPNSAPDKLMLLLWHMSIGMAVTILTIMRFFVRRRSKRPKPDKVNVISQTVQRSFYVMVLLMAATGMTTALLARLNHIVFAKSGEPLPASFDHLLSADLHQIFAISLAFLIALHLGTLFRASRREEAVWQRMIWPRRGKH